MSTSFPLRTLLGITQEDMAQLLGIGRSQWAMFETGKRDLPTKAKLLLAEITYGLQPQGRAKKRTQLPFRNAEMERYLTGLLHQNEFRRIGIARKLDAATKKQETNLKVMQLARSFSDKLSTDPDASAALVNRLAAKASQVMHDKELTALFQYQIRLELLDAEREQLNAMRNSYSAAPGRTAKTVASSPKNSTK